MKKFFTGLLVCGMLVSAQAQEKIPFLIHLKKSGKTEKSLTMNRATNILTENLPVSSSDDFKMLHTNRDNQGYEHQKFQQYYNGIKVEFGQYSVHGKNGEALTMSGHYVPVKGIKTTPRLSRTASAQAALSLSGVAKDATVSEGKLVICEDFVKQTYTPALAYKYTVEGTKDGEYYKANLYINAMSGQLLLENPLVYHHHERSEKLKKLASTTKHNHNILTPGNAATRYSGTQTIEGQSVSGGYRLYDNTRGGGIHTKNANNSSSWNFNSATEFVDNDNNWTAGEWNNSNLDNAALDAHWASEMTYDYYKDIHGRDSYDGQGTIMKNLVHALNNWFNAQWNGSTMRYGDGNASNPLTTIDVGAHEMSHGVTQFSAGLVYRGESGALNEAFSDIFAACVENFIDGSLPGQYKKQLWKIGEEIGYIRNMENPNDKGHPDTYKGTNWASTSGGDNGGVHTNSGVLNHWFYLLSVGKSGSNDNGDSYTVDGITIEKAEKIAYRMLTVYLSSSSKYNAAREAGIQAAIDLYGQGSEEEKQTTNAFYAVGIGESYGGGGDPDPTPTCDALSFDGKTLITHSNGDDGNYTADGTTVALTGNTWRALPLNYTVTSGTVLEFEFSSTGEGEIHGIGFDNNSGASSDLLFQVYGTQNWGETDFDNYTSGEGWKKYSIPIGQYYTGSYDRLVFSNDNDNGSGSNSSFRNIIIHEGDCNTTTVIAPPTSLIESDGLQATIYPVPGSRVLNIKGEETGSYTIQSMRGEKVLQGTLGDYDSKVDISGLKNGMYVLRIGEKIVRFIKK